MQKRPQAQALLLRHDADVALDAREAERVWERMQSWAPDRFGGQIGGALKEHMDARGVGTDERPALAEDLSLALCWLLIDRDVETGSTPAQLYSQRSELSVGERQVAARIAASGLGLHRVREAEPGARIELEDLLDGRIVCVSSANVSHEAVRWHLLLCRVMHGGPTPSLWGAAGSMSPPRSPSCSTSSDASRPRSIRGRHHWAAHRPAGRRRCAAVLRAAESSRPAGAAHAGGRFRRRGGSLLEAPRP